MGGRVTDASRDRRSAQTSVPRVYTHRGVRDVASPRGMGEGVDPAIAAAPTVAQVRREQRMRRMGNVYRGHVRRIASVVVAIAIVAFALIFVYRSDLFPITSVEATGNVHLSEGAITQLAAVPADTTILRVDKAGITGRLKSSPWVESVSIVRHPPDTLELRITERTVAATVVVGGAGVSGSSEPWAIAPDGTWLAPVKGLGLASQQAGQADAPSQDGNTAAQAAPKKVDVEADADDDGIPDAYDSDADGDGKVDAGKVDADEDGYTDGMTQQVTVYTTDEDGDETTERVTRAELPGYSYMVDPDTGDRVSVADYLASGDASDGAGQANAQAGGSSAGTQTVDAQSAEDAALADNPDAIDFSSLATQVTITGYASAGTPVAGEACTDEGVTNALSMLSQMSGELSSRITTISAESAEQTSFLLDNGVEVSFGAATNVADKERVVLSLLSEHEGSISYINVRVADRPTWRGLSS